MRRILLSTTALVAAGLLVTSVAYADEHEAMPEEEAMAEEEMAADEEMAAEEELMLEEELAMEEEMAAADPVSLGISGFAFGAFGASTDASSPNMYQSVDLNLKGEATMDNGLTFGVASKLQTAAERVVTVGGAFGTITLGEARSARSGSRIASKTATASFGVNGPYAGGVAAVVGTNGSSHGASHDSKILYTSPPVGGISLAASYAPGGTKTAASVIVKDGVPDVKPASATASDQISAALTFTQALGDASVTLNAGYEVASGTGNTSPTDLNVGATVEMGDIAVSGGMWDADPGGMQMDIGAVLTMGALKLSGGWGSTDTTDMYAIGASYPLGEGVQFDTQLDFGDKAGDEWVQFLAGVAINF